MNLIDRSLDLCSMSAALQQQQSLSLYFQLDEYVKSIVEAVDCSKKIAPGIKHSEDTILISSSLDRREQDILLYVTFV